MKPTPSSLRRLSVFTLWSVYFLILVGGIVRSTGSGMGCPDWPKCFGSWVPPTEASQLPFDYKQVYAEQRLAKNERLSNYLGALGFAQIADQLKNDPAIAGEEEFNATKTWVEYVNRLIGALVGLFILATFAASIPHWKNDRSLVIASATTVIAVGLQGWIGSVVVSTNLLPWMITVHMLLALFIVALLTFVALRAGGVQSITVGPVRSRIGATLGVLLVLTLIQIVMGTQVRESVNEVSQTLGEAQRENWIAGLDWVFYVHRSYSIIVLLGHLYLVYLAYQNFGQKGNLTRWAGVLLVVIVTEILSGVIMAYFAIPRFAQPLHLILATGAFGVQVLLLLKMYPLAMRQRQPYSDQYASY
ncbi:MAG: COX15/CtaA family protein [Tunicatimonas sp.]